MSEEELEQISDRYNSILESELSDSLSNSFSTIVSEVGCRVLSIKNVEDVKKDIEKDPFLNSFVGKFASFTSSTFGVMFALITLASIFGKHKLKEKYDRCDIEEIEYVEEDDRDTQEVEARTEIINTFVEDEIDNAINSVIGG